MNFGSGLASSGTSKEAKKHLDKFRIQVSLGSIVSEVKDTSADGFTINYSDGDVCNKETGQRFSTQIIHICDNTQSSEDYKPAMPELKNYKDCVYTFYWRSRYACPLCRTDQAHIIQGQCEPASKTAYSTSYAEAAGLDYNGMRRMFYEPYSGEKCVVYSQDHLTLRDGTKITHFEVSTPSSVQFVTQQTDIEECNIY